MNKPDTSSIKSKLNLTLDTDPQKDQHTETISATLLSVTPTLTRRPFWYFIKLHKFNFIVGTITLLLTNVFDVASPYFIGKTIDLLAAKEMHGFYLYMLILVGVSIGTAIFRYLWRIYFSRFHQQVAADLRNILFRKLLALTVQEHQKTTTGEKMTLLTQDIDNFRMGIGPGALIFFDALIYTIGLVPLMILVSWSWTWKCLILMPLIPIFTYIQEKTFTKRYRDMQDKTGELTSFAQESVSGIRVIKALSLQKYRSLLFQPLNKKLHDYGLKIDQVESAFGPILELFIMIGTATLLFVGTKDVINETVSIGSFFAFYQYLLRMIWPMTAFGFSFMMYKEAESSFDRINEVLTSPHDVPTGTVLARKGGDLEVKNLSFNFLSQNQPALLHLSFTLKSDESLAIVGPVGAGKSTLAQILSRNIHNYSGEVLYQNESILNLTKDSFRQILTMVPQDVFLFKRSIEENLTGFNLSHSDAVMNTLRDVQFLEDLKSLPHGLNTPLQEKGSGLSGGQRQRLTLARGLLSQPQWLILDDSLSAVDIDTEQKIMTQLFELKKNGALNFIICSHRIQNIRWVDKILVLNDGQCVDIGRHEELMERCALYQNLYQSHKQHAEIKKSDNADASYKPTSSEDL